MEFHLNCGDEYRWRAWLTRSVGECHGPLATLVRSASADGDLVHPRGLERVHRLRAKVIERVLPFVLYGKPLRTPLMMSPA